jgi:hypothetical protein
MDFVPISGTRQHTYLTDYVICIDNFLFLEPILVQRGTAPSIPSGQPG